MVLLLSLALSADALPDSMTAMAVAKPLMARYMGQSYVDVCESFEAKKIGRFWAVSGKPRVTKEDIAFEPYFVVLDSTNCELVAQLVHTNREALFRNLRALPEKNEKVAFSTAADALATAGLGRRI